MKAPGEWTRRFKAEWNAIKVEYSAALTRGAALPGPSAPGVQQAVEQVFFMMGERINALEKA
jgi:hypothetical protein